MADPSQVLTREYLAANKTLVESSAEIARFRERAEALDSLNVLRLMDSHESLRAKVEALQSRFCDEHQGQWALKPDGACLACAIMRHGADEKHLWDENDRLKQQVEALTRERDEAQSAAMCANELIHDIVDRDECKLCKSDGAEKCDVAEICLLHFKGALAMLDQSEAKLSSLTALRPQIDPLRDALDSVLLTRGADMNHGEKETLVRIDSLLMSLEDLIPREKEA